jgi:phage terminase large subunit-like protein
MVNLSYDEKVNLAKLLAERNRRNAGRAFFTFFPDDGPLSRVHYPKHLRFMDLGAVMKTRCFMAGNRIGKTVTGAYEMTCHLTGRYPHWWTGRRFTASISAWCAGDTSKTVRDIIQLALMGKIGEFGTGMIPREDIMRTTSKQGVSDAIETIYVRHVSGEVSICGLKSYDQGRQAFQGTAQDVIWLDEESDESIRSECILRLMTTQGLLIETFTPLKGITPIVMTYLPGETMQDDGKGAFVSPDRAMVMAGWDDVPHLAEEDKARMKAETPPHLLEARSTGKPAIGSGAIYPIPEAEITVNDFVIPKHWRRAYGFDVGWNCTAALWGAIDPTDGTLYIYSQYKDGKKEPPIHATAIKTRGKWIPGAIDPASRGGSQKDGEKLLTLYRAEGLELTPADNTVEVALDDIWRAFSTGQIKVFRSLRGFFEEYRLYRRNEKGQVVKINDHLVDCLRYLWRTGRTMAVVQPVNLDPGTIEAQQYKTSAMAS